MSAALGVVGVLGFVWILTFLFAAFVLDVILPDPRQESPTMDAGWGFGPNV